MAWLLFSTMQTFARVSQPAVAGVACRAVLGSACVPVRQASHMA